MRKVTGKSKCEQKTEWREGNRALHICATSWMRQKVAGQDRHAVLVRAREAARTDVEAAQPLVSLLAGLPAMVQRLDEGDVAAPRAGDCCEPTRSRDGLVHTITSPAPNHAPYNE